MKLTAPVWTMRGKSAYSHVETVPGPGTYSPTTSVLHASPQYKVGTSKRKEISDFSATPGPGSYTPSSTDKSPSWTFFGKSSRIRGKSNNNTPGPGTYHIPNPQDSPKFSVGKSLRNSSENEKIIPGPGAYNPEYQSFKGNNMCNISIALGGPVEITITSLTKYQVLESIPYLLLRKALRIPSGQRPVLSALMLSLGLETMNRTLKVLEKSLLHGCLGERKSH